MSYTTSLNTQALGYWVKCTPFIHFTDKKLES